MRSSRRLERLYPELSAKEQALLVLGSRKDGREEDPEWRLMMPDSQVQEFNQVIVLMNGVMRLSLIVVALRLAVEKLSLRLGVAKEEPQGLHEEAQRYTGPFELAGPGGEEIGWLRSIVELG